MNSVTFAGLVFSHLPGGVILLSVFLIKNLEEEDTT